jgi:dTDP-4-dehydrorhamnose 3,5-epimerase
MARFTLQPTRLPEVVIAQRHPIGDHRGFFERLFCPDELADFMCADSVVQINRSRTSRRGTVRGMHLQTGAHAEKKIVTCLRGAVFDIAVDLRPQSANYGHWVGVELNESNHLSLLIPEGFAHGFQTLVDDVELLYVHSQAYAPDAEGGVNPLDGDVAIAWPLEITEMSARDATLPNLPSRSETRE